MRNRTFSIVSIICLFMGMFGHSLRAESSQDTIITTIYPLTYVTQRLAPKGISVRCPIPKDADPLFWQPTRTDIQLMQKASLVITSGAGLEMWMDTITLPKRLLVETGLSFKAQWIHYENAITHSHGPEGDHSHEGLDCHVWLDPLLLLKQAETIHQALLNKWPNRTAPKALDTLKGELNDLHKQLSALGNVRVVASHPAYNYLAKRYKWAVVNLDLDPQVALTDTALSDTLSALNAHQTTVLLWESTPVEATRQALANKGITCVTFSPIEQPPAKGDYLNVMRANIARLKTTLMNSPNLKK